MSIMTGNATGLARFHTAQSRVYPKVVREIQRGVKETHWMWFIFPQLRALAKSDMAQRYGIADRDEAVAYLDNTTLRVRLFECASGVLRQRRLMFGGTDTRKLHACMTLFREVADDPSLPNAVLAKFYDGAPHALTMDVLEGRPIPVQMPPRLTFPANWHQPRLTPSQRRDRVDPWTRERMLSFVRSFGLSSVATRQLVDAWLADQGRARREGYERGFGEGRDEGYDEAQSEFESDGYDYQ